MDKILCYSCGIPKNSLKHVKSQLIGINLIMCDSCISNEYEPRWAIVIAGRQNGSDKVKEYVLNKKYVGDEIVASELLI